VNITGITASYGNVAAKITPPVAGSALNYTSSIPACVISDGVPVKVKISASFKYNGASIGTPIINGSSGGTSGIISVTAADIDSGSNNAAAFTVKSPNPGTPPKTYTVTFTKDSGNKAMATGGTTVKFVKSGTGDTTAWDEVHIFKSTGDPSTLAVSRAPASNTVKALIVAGGGGGGGSGDGFSSSGGGAGGVIMKTGQSLSATSYTIKVGGGGSAGSSGSQSNSKDGSDGADSYIKLNSDYVYDSPAKGGGGGGRHAAGNGGVGHVGGSGGGGYSGGGKGTTNQGKNGGNHGNYGAAGGGGFSGAGSVASGTETKYAFAAAGGAGLTTSTPTHGATLSGIIAGLTQNDAPTSYAAGGGGGGNGLIDAKANTGNGGGGKNSNGPGTVKPGSSGIVIVRFPFSE
jgi:hypothetical protein